MGQEVDEREADAALKARHRAMWALGDHRENRRHNRTIASG
jgi:hypothetical protein